MTHAHDLERTVAEDDVLGRTALAGVDEQRVAQDRQARTARSTAGTTGCDVCGRRAFSNAQTQ